MITCSVLAAVVASMCVFTANGGRGKVQVAFVSATNEFGIDWVVFRIKNHTNRRVIGQFDVQLKGPDGWFPLADKKHSAVSSTYDLRPEESTDVDVMWQEDMRSWRVHSINTLQLTSFESWQFRLAHRLRNYSTTCAKILEPAIHSSTVDGPEMQMKTPAP